MTDSLSFCRRSALGLSSGEQAASKFAAAGAGLSPSRLSFVTNGRHRKLGWLQYCERSPRRLWVTMSRACHQQGEWGIWYLVSNRPLSARQAAAEYSFRFACEEGFKDAKWWLGFKRARIRDIRAWSRLFALFAVALLALASLGTVLLIPGDKIDLRPLLMALHKVEEAGLDRPTLKLVYTRGEVLGMTGWSRTTLWRRCDEAGLPARKKAFTQAEVENLVQWNLR
jgi:hypothetical protein